MKYGMSFALVGLMVLVVGCAPARQPINQNWASGEPQAPLDKQPEDSQWGVTGQAGEAGNGYMADSALVSMLVGRLGVDSQQAMGGAGSIFSLAQQRMNPSDFIQLSGSLPGMDRYLAAVPTQSPSRVIWGSATNISDGQGGALGRLAVLAATFQSLGMRADMIGQFVPLVLQYVQGQSGPAMTSLLQNALY